MLTVLHVAFGTLALLAAPVAFFAPKGGRLHLAGGKLFVGAMALVLFSAGFLWQTKGHLFLVPLGFVSAYLLFSGYRALVRKRRRVVDPIEDRIDMLAAVAGAAAGVGSVYLGAAATTPLLHGIAPALLCIGAIGIAFALNDVLGFASRRSPSGWMLSHFAGMIAAYASAVTAFVVINAHGVPMLLRWFVPVGLGGALIVATTLRYVRLRFPRASSPPDRGAVARATPPRAFSP